MAGGDKCSLAVKQDGTLWAWGDNGSGVLGTSNNTYYSSPVQVGSLTNWRKIHCRQKNAGAIKSDGTIWAWGYNDEGILGIGVSGNKNSPIQIGSATNWLSAGATGNAGNHMLVLREG